MCDVCVAYHRLHGVSETYVWCNSHINGECSTYVLHAHTLLWIISVSYFVAFQEYMYLKCLYIYFIKLLDLIEWTFKRALKTMVHFIWPVMTEKLFLLPLTKGDIHFGHVRMYSMPYPISWIIFIFDLEPSYTEKLLESRWVPIPPLS